MPRTFDVSADSPATVDQVHAAFGDEGYWQARLVAFGAGRGGATLDSLVVDADGTVMVAATFSLVRDLLPTLVTHFGRGDMRMLHTETWSRLDETQFRGEFGIEVPGIPVSGAGAAVVAPLGSGSRLTYSATVKVNVPLVGGKIESLMSARLAEGILDIHRFTAAWIAENG